jgi:DNA-binding CsgD family transcriptional regulator
MFLTRSDHDSLLRFLPSMYAARSLDSFPNHLVDSIPSLVKSDTAAFNVIDLNSENPVRVHLKPEPETYGIKDFAKIAERLIDQHPLVNHFMSTSDNQARGLNDFMSPRELHRLPIYNEIFRKMHAEYLVCIASPRYEGGQFALTLSREHTDFNDRERALLTMLQPHFVQAYENAREITALKREADALHNEIDENPKILEHALGLSGREANVLFWIARGKTAAETATILAISRRTIEKHLERIYRKLAAESRMGAAAAAWQAFRNNSNCGAPPPRR